MFLLTICVKSVEHNALIGMIGLRWKSNVNIFLVSMQVFGDFLLLRLLFWNETQGIVDISTFFSRKISWTNFWMNHVSWWTLFWNFSCSFLWLLISIMRWEWWWNVFLSIYVWRCSTFTLDLSTYFIFTRSAFWIWIQISNWKNLSIITNDLMLRSANRTLKQITCSIVIWIDETGSAPTGVYHSRHASNISSKLRHSLAKHMKRNISIGSMWFSFHEWISQLDTTLQTKSIWNYSMDVD